MYDAARSEPLVEAVEVIVDNPDRLQSMKHRAYEYARSEFNWEEQSRSYRALILSCVAVDKVSMDGGRRRILVLYWHDLPLEEMRAAIRRISMC